LATYKGGISLLLIYIFSFPLNFAQEYF